MESCLYVGSLRHRRREPVAHEFAYPVFMLYLDLEELETLFRHRLLWSADRPAPARFLRRDHLGEREVRLLDAVRSLVESRTGSRPEGPVRLLTQLRYFGYGFNPVSFYYCYDTDGADLSTIVAEINNTPWGEQYCYVLSDPAPGSTAWLKRFSLDKAFHVSPFMGMDIRYRWQFTRPGASLSVHMESYRDQDKCFDATLRLKRQTMTTWNLNTKLVSYPLAGASVVARIYWQALKLWWKRSPFYPHPGSAVDDERQQGAGTRREVY